MGDSAASRHPRIWVVTELFHPETTSTGRFLTGIAEELAKSFAVSVICSQPTYRARGTIAPSREVLNGVHIRRCRATRFDKGVLPLRVMNIVTISASLTLALLFQMRRGDVVMVVTNPPLLPFLVVGAARLRRARPVILVHDVYPEVLSAAGVLTTDSVLWRITARATSWLYNSAERVIVIGRDMWDLAARKIHQPSGRLVLIPNWGDTDEVRPRSSAPNRVRQEFALEKRFVVQYLGNMGRTHGVEDLVAAAIVLRHDDEIKFLFVGSGSKRCLIADAVKAKSLRNVLLLDPCEDSELPEFLAAADVAVIAHVSGMSGISVPSRMYNVMASGTPIIGVTDETSEMARTINENEIGWVIPPGDVKGLCEAIRTARAHPELLAEMGKRARASALHSYTRSTVGESFRSLARDIVNP
jgi:colanic acid biosynthesis glycosyl transferase WcaI